MRATHIGRWLVVVAVLFAAVGCGGDATLTDEYIALEDDLLGTANQLRGSQAAEEQLRVELEQAQSELEEAQSDLAVAELNLVEWRGRATVAEDQLDAELNKPWPEAAKALFVEDCISEPYPEVTAEEAAALCSCVVDSLEGSVSFADFMILSLSALDSDAELNPLTGFPTNLDEDVAEIFVEALTTCVFTSTATEAVVSYKSDGPYTLGVSNTVVGNGWRDQMVCAIKAEALASGKVDEVILIERNTGVDGQIADVRSLIDKGVDAILLNPVHHTALDPVISEASQAGIPVFAIDNGVSSPHAFSVTTDQRAYGELGARWLFDTLGGEGRIVYMRGIRGIWADDLRDEGFSAALRDYPGIEIVEETYTDWDPAKGGEQIRTILATEEFDGIWTSGIDYSVVKQFQDAGVPYVPIVGADNNAFIEQLITIDELTGIAVTNPPSIGGVATSLALTLLEGEELDHLNLIEPVVLDTPQELSEAFVVDLPSGWSSYMVVQPYVHYTVDEVIACKGPSD